MQPECIAVLEEEQPSFTIDFTTRSGRVFGFPYVCLEYFQHFNDKDPKLKGPDRLIFQFSTAQVHLQGWRLKNLIPLLRHGRLISIIAVDERYQGTSGSNPFVSEINVLENDD